MTYPEMQTLIVGKKYKYLSGNVSYNGVLMLANHVEANIARGTEEEFIFEHTYKGEISQVHLTVKMLFQYNLKSLN